MLNKIYQIHIASSDTDPNSKEIVPINQDNWKKKVDVNAAFHMKHDGSNIYLHFEVNESNIIAIHKDYNQPVYEDSCVEFFISFDSKNYYNFEFNCIGNILGAWGTDRQNREYLSQHTLQRITTNPSLGFNRIQIVNRPSSWSLKVTIPKDVFVYDQIDSFYSLLATGNLYKCGDKQVEPHFLSWAPINTAKPDFHRPECFGQFIFE
jgi:hypothetical protein